MHTVQCADCSCYLSPQEMKMTFGFAGNITEYYCLQCGIDYINNGKWLFTELMIENDKQYMDCIPYEVKQ